MAIENPIQLVILCSPSGAGKTTLARLVLADPQLGGMHFSVSHTTRAPRRGEVEGRDYYFVDEKAFRAILDRGGFAEHAVVHGKLYGTSVAEIDRISALAGARSILFDIDVQGARQLVKRYPDALTVFILPPSIQELRSRLSARATDSPEAVALRMRNAAEEIRSYREFDYLVLNDVLELARAELRTVIAAHRIGRTFRAHIAEALLAALEGGRT